MEEKPKPNRTWVTWLVVVVGILLVLFSIYRLHRYDVLDQTPEVKRLESDAAKGDDTAIKNLDAMLANIKAETATLCRLKSICSHYGVVRQECATAGSFQTCVAVKMGAQDEDSVDACTDDGHLAVADDRIPNDAKCWINSVIQ